jgi:hypothetical protein
MPRTLSPRPDIRQLRRQAKELLRQALAGEASAVARIHQVGRQPSLASAQLALAREHGFGSWPALRRAVSEVLDRPLVGSTHAPRHRAFSWFRDASGGGGGEAPEAMLDAEPVGTLFAFGSTFSSALEFTEALHPLDDAPSTAFGSDDGRLLARRYRERGAEGLVAEVERQARGGAPGRFLLIGTAAAIGSEVEAGDVVVVEAALADDALSHYYSPPPGLIPADADLSVGLTRELCARGVTPRSGVTWTVPTLYRSLHRELRAATPGGPLVVECEVASLLAVALARGVAAGACLLVTSTFASNYGFGSPSPATIAEAALAALGDRR